MHTNKKILLTAIAALIGISACSGDMVTLRRESAKRVAMPVFMLPRQIQAGDFTLQAYERIHKRNGDAVVYIEGDGKPYITSALTSDEPTPADPVALRLAAQDGSDNVVAIARPCQYVMSMDKWGKDCPATFWTDGRFSEQVLESYSAALDNLKAQYGIKTFHVVGYDGGAAIAAILTTMRSDIKTLRTVAGNLDHKVMSDIHKTKPLTQSLNPVDFAQSLASVPQRHYIGKLDKVVPPAVYASYAQALADNSCAAVTLVDNADHERGWVEQWKALKDLPVDCTNPETPPKLETLSWDDMDKKGKHAK